MIKLLSNTTTHAVLLIVVLVFYAWSLGKDVRTLQTWRGQQATLASDNLRLVYATPSGIAVDGTLIAASGDKHHVAFLLRNESLQHDLDFWDQVHALIASRKDIGLTAYCDSQQCVESIRKLKPPRFPVLAYGEAVSIQAVVNEDVRGRAIRRVAGAATDSIIWRTPGASPERAVQEALR